MCGGFGGKAQSVLLHGPHFDGGPSPSGINPTAQYRVTEPGF
jgi:hypothetical protein